MLVCHALIFGEAEFPLVVVFAGETPLVTEPPVLSLRGVGVGVDDLATGGEDLVGGVDGLGDGLNWRVDDGLPRD